MNYKKTVIYDGESHFRIGDYFIDFICAIAVVVSLIAFCDLAVFLRIGLIYIGAKLANCAMGPDLDLPKNRAKRQWGRLGWIWIPYSNFVPHRGILSHGLKPPKRWRHSKIAWWIFRWFGFSIGTLARSVYLASILLTICAVLNWIVGSTFFTDKIVLVLFSETTLWLVVGVGVSDFIHTKFDWLTSR